MTVLLCQSEAPGDYIFCKFKLGHKGPCSWEKKQTAVTDYNEPFEMAKQRVAIVERVMKLPYIKATRDTSRGEERFVCRDDVIKAVHDYAVIAREAVKP